MRSATFEPLREGAIPVLYLHRVDPLPADWRTWTQARKKLFLAYDVIPAAFAAQLDWLEANGYTTVLPSDLAAHWDHGVPLPSRPVIITFDDGYQSWLTEALPMLRAHGMTAEFYLTLDAIREGQISWDQVRRLAAAGMGIGAHDVNHIQLTQLSGGRPPASAKEMYYQVHMARVIIGQEIGTPPDSMAYVGGGFDVQLEAQVKKAGYTTARTIQPGIHQDAPHRFELHVVRVGAYEDVCGLESGEMVPGLPVFASRIAGPMP